MNREKHFHPLAALHLLRKTLLVYLLPLVQVLFDRNWDALRAALRQELVLLFFISAGVLGGVLWWPLAGGCRGHSARQLAAWRAAGPRPARRRSGGAGAGAAAGLPADRCLPGGAVPCGADHRPSLCILPGSRPRSLPMCCCR